jgi:hypothetical protein
MYTQAAPAQMAVSLQEASDKTLPFPLVNSPFFHTLLKERQFSAREREYLEYYRKYGYVIIEESIVDESLSGRIAQDVSAQLPSGENRLQDGWLKSPAIKSVATNPVVLSLLRLLYGREPIPFQTLNFLRGSEQRTHSDVIHFSSLPTGFMCGVWTALEDITINQGPLHYYPGSQDLPELDYYDLGISEEHVYPENPHEGEPSWDNPRTLAKYKLYEDCVERLMAEHGFKREALTLKRGQSLVWSSNLFHGGNKILDPASTRRSQVTHFQFEGTIPWTPMFSNARMGDYHLPELRNLCTGQAVERTFNYLPVDLVPMAKVSRYKIRLKSGNFAADARTFLTKEYHEEMTNLSDQLEFYRRENEQLRQTLNAIQQTRLWKVMEPLRALSGKLRGGT